MGGETPELALEQAPQDASTKKLSECLKRIGDELDSNMELQRCGPWAPGIQPLAPFSLTSPEAPLPLGLEFRSTVCCSLGPRRLGPTSLLSSLAEKPFVLQDTGTFPQGVVFPTFLTVPLAPFPQGGPFSSVTA